MEKFPTNIPRVSSVRVAEAVDGERQHAFLPLAHLLALLDLFVSCGARSLRESVKIEWVATTVPLCTIFVVPWSVRVGSRSLRSIVLHFTTCWCHRRLHSSSPVSWGKRLARRAVVLHTPQPNLWKARLNSVILAHSNQLRIAKLPSNYNVFACRYQNYGRRGFPAQARRQAPLTTYRPFQRPTLRADRSSRRLLAQFLSPDTYLPRLQNRTMA